ncbi:MAG: sugar phosphate nucleotidyltransferase [Verrucomicrobia bacterium]|nr:sugar phosphate nucleotidyltransferase [Verrucomicrobiota bacterium]MDA1085842.1 sugar phosphate nucleotidyltransferase [Verrucomicrobiota bacterium]
MSKSLVVLAAGIGSRYGGLKQMDPMGPSGEFIIDYSVFDAMRAGFDKAVFVIRRDIEEDFRATIGKRIEDRIDTRYVFQELSDLPDGFDIPDGRSKPWGTSHAILAATDGVREPFAVVNGDDFYGRESYETLGAFLDQSADNASAYAMVGFTLRGTLSDHGTVTRGICHMAAGDLLESVIETSALERDGDGARTPDGAYTGDELASMNMWGFKPSLFSHLQSAFLEFLRSSGNELKSECLIPAVVDALVQNSDVSVRVLPTSSPWFGVTNPDDKPKVVAAIQRLIDQGEYPGSLWA